MSQLFQAEASEQADAHISSAFMVPFAQSFCLFVCFADLRNYPSMKHLLEKKKFRNFLMPFKKLYRLQVKMLKSEEIV